MWALGQKSIGAALAVTLMVLCGGITGASAAEETAEACKDCVIEIQTESCYDSESGYICSGIEDAVSDYAKDSKLGKLGVKFKIEGSDTIYGK